MIGARRMDAVIKAHRPLGARLVHGKLEPFDMDRIFLRSPADLLRGTLDPLREKLPESLPAGDPFHHRDHRLGVAETQVQTAGIRFGQDPPFVTFHGERNADARRNRVNAVSRADLVGFHQSHDVVDPAVRTEGGDGLVLGAAVADVHGNRPLDLHHPLAPDGTGKTGLPPFHIPLFEHVLGADPRDFRKGTALKVPHRQVSGDFVIGDGGARAHLDVAGRLRVVILPHPLRQFQDLRLVRRLRHSLPPDGDSLQLLRPHNGAQTGPAGEMTDVVRNAGEKDEFLAARTDQGRLDPIATQFRLDRLIRFRDFLSPNAGSVPYLAGAVVDPDIDGRRRCALDDDGIVSGALEFRAPESAGLRLAERARLRRFGPDAVPAGPSHGLSRQTSRGKHELVEGTERVCIFRHFGQKGVNNEAPAAQVMAVIVFGGLKGLALPVREIHAEKLAVVTFHNPSSGIVRAARKRGTARIRLKRFFYAKNTFPDVTMPSRKY
ncbi:MAG: hypothetical protein A4E73_00409 [Syntrophaceae bacterium PtaU1.Bin231]|nr:MAG: hypothetical protein A4E73_00409 [Syntrophaceae bacterium PtaU1.Bin231]